jgi:putative addiction module component (TIGR02574 family)
MIFVFSDKYLNIKKLKSHKRRDNKMHIKDIPQLDQLSISDKILLVEELWDNIYSEADQVPVPQSHIAELENRLARYTAHPETLLSFDELRTRIESRK